MKIRCVVGAIAVLAVAGCGGQTKPAAESSEASVSSAASTEATTSSEVTTSMGAATTTGAATTAAAAPAKGEIPNREFVIGKWGTDGDCVLAIDLRADGTSDGPFGNWSYTDGAISFADAPELKVNVTVVDENTMASVNSDGKSSTMTRCP